MAKKRITELATETTLKDGQYVAIDHTTDGTKKLNLGAELTDLKEELEHKSGLSEDMKQALLACFGQVAWIGDDGQDYYDALEEALYPPADLVSISAVYTQSGAITNWNTLDDLKSDLVVTANFDDGTTTTIANYALSGDLVAPSSVITVTYGGKTATFTVTVTYSPLPSGYTAYDYLTQTVTLGAKHNAYAIITDASTNSENKIEFDIAYSSTIESSLNRDPVLGSRNGNSGTQNVTYYPCTGRTSQWNLFGTVVETAQMVKGNRYSIKYLPVGKSETYPDNNVLVVNGTEKNTNISVTNSDLRNWFGIFGYAVSAGTNTNNENYFRGEQIGEIKIYDSNDELIYDYIPAKDSSDRYGFYDVVNMTFWYNSSHATDGYDGGYWSES